MGDDLSAINVFNVKMIKGFQCILCCQSRKGGNIGILQSFVNNQESMWM